MVTDLELLLREWPGPGGGVPPFRAATPEALEAAYRMTIDATCERVQAIAADPAPPTFANTVEALEAAGRPLRRLDGLFRLMAATMSSPELREVEQRVARLKPALEDEISHDGRLFARVEAVHRSADTLPGEARRLTEVIRRRMVRSGAGLEPSARARLAVIHGRLAELQARFTQNLTAEEDERALFLEDEADLEGLSDGLRAAARAAATERGRPQAWAVPNNRAGVWPFLTASARRDLRERVWRMWTSRGANPGEHDNRPVVAEFLRLRGEKARLLGAPSFAHWTLESRMAQTPEAALDLLRQAWDRVLPLTGDLLADLETLAAEEGADITVEPWDRRYYAERLRRQRFRLDAEEAKPYLESDALIQAVLWAAGRLYGLEFAAAEDLEAWHPDVKLFTVRRGGAHLGLVAFDLAARKGKTPGMWSTAVQVAERFGEWVAPFAMVSASLARTGPGDPLLLSWLEATVLFHEFGHALHMLSCEAPYPSLDSLQVEWDMIELPALLNERWIFDRELLHRFARHHRTGEPIPDDLVGRIEEAARFDRVFSLNLDYLAPAFVDMRMHLAADGGEVDALEIQSRVFAELGLPSAVDPLMYVPHLAHAFWDQYAAGLYVYLWGDVLAADVAEAFLEAPGGLFDRGIAERFRSTILSVGASVPAEQAFRNFRGRDPDPGALLRRFGLENER
jgi:peptidyl-dipeptidase Dcp